MVASALHTLDPDFKQFSLNDRTRALARSLGLKDPVVLQGMIIFKVRRWVGLRCCLTRRSNQSGRSSCIYVWCSNPTLAAKVIGGLSHRSCGRLGADVFGYCIDVPSWAQWCLTRTRRFSTRSRCLRSAYGSPWRTARRRTAALSSSRAPTKVRRRRPQTKIGYVRADLDPALLPCACYCVSEGLHNGRRLQRKQNEIGVEFTAPAREYDEKAFVPAPVKAGTVIRATVQPRSHLAMPSLCGCVTHRLLTVARRLASHHTRQRCAPLVGQPLGQEQDHLHVPPRRRRARLHLRRT